MILLLLGILDMIFIMCDALRDRGCDRKVGWWEWHIPKWVSFYGVQIMLVLLCYKCNLIHFDAVSLFVVGCYAVLAKFVWNLTYGG